MRIRLPMLAMLLSLAFVAGLAATPAALDPVRVAPHIYELAFENDKIRVLRKTIRNGETPALHAHPDRVIVYVNSCAWMVENEAGEKHMDGGVTSNVVQTCAVVEIELK